MPQTTSNAPRWYTASAGRAADVSPLDQSLLQSHVLLCRLRYSRLSDIGNGVLGMQGLVATRFATVALTVGLVAAGLLWLC